MKQTVIYLVVLSVAGAMSTTLLPASKDDLVSAQPEKKTYLTAPNPWSKDEVLEAEKAGEWHGEVRLERQSDGQFYVEAMANGMPFKAIVDTGADVVALPAEDAHRIGLNWTEDEIHVIGRGASGEVRGVVRQVDKLTVQGMTVRDVQLVVIPEGLHVALLGQNFLSQISSVHLKGDTMFLSNL